MTEGDRGFSPAPKTSFPRPGGAWLRPDGGMTIPGVVRDQMRFSRVLEVLTAQTRSMRGLAAVEEVAGEFAAFFR